MFTDQLRWLVLVLGVSAFEGLEPPILRLGLRRSPFAVHRSLFTVRCSPFAVRCSLFAGFNYVGFKKAGCTAHPSNAERRTLNASVKHGLGWRIGRLDSVSLQDDVNSVSGLRICS